MNTNIEISNINKHFFLNIQDYENDDNNKKYKNLTLIPRYYIFISYCKKIPCSVLSFTSLN